MSSGFEVFIGFLISVGVVSYAVGQWRMGRQAAAKNTIDLLERRAQALEDSLNDAKVENKKNHEDIIRLQEQLKHKDIELDRYVKIFENRDPSLAKFIELVTTYVAYGKDSMDQFKKDLVEINGKDGKLDRMESKLNQLLSDGKVK